PAPCRRGVLGGDPGRHGLAVLDLAQGIHPERGYRPDPGHHARCRRYVIRVDDEASAGGRRHHRGRSQRGRVLLVHRRRRPDLLITNPQVKLTIDRDRSSILGVTATQIEDGLYSAYGSRQVSTIYTPNNEYWVIVELLPEFQRDATALGMLYIRSNQNTMVP